MSSFRGKKDRKDNEKTEALTIYPERIDCAFCQDFETE